MCSWSILTYFSYLIPFNGVYRYPVMIYIYNLKLPSCLENLPEYPTVVSSNPLRSGSCFLRYFNGRFMISSSSLVCVVNCCFIDGVTPCVARTLFFGIINFYQTGFNSSSWLNTCSFYDFFSVELSHHFCSFSYPVWIWMFNIFLKQLLSFGFSLSFV